jgi:hypothetical protein
VLDPDQLQGAAETFGVDESQVLRDHLISHLLAAISAEAAEQIVFFGGTALARSSSRPRFASSFVAYGPSRDSRKPHLAGPFSFGPLGHHRRPHRHRPVDPARVKAAACDRRATRWLTIASPPTLSCVRAGQVAGC